MPDIFLAPWDPRQQALNRRRAMAQVLAQQSVQPIEEPNYPGAKISAWQGIAKMAQALVAGLANRRLDREQTALNNEIQGANNIRMQDFIDVLVPKAQGERPVCRWRPRRICRFPIG